MGLEMKVLVATEKPFAAAAVNGIKAEVEAAGNELVLLEKYTEKAQLLDAVKDADAMIIRSDKVDSEVLDAAKVDVAHGIGCISALSLQRHEAAVFKQRRRHVSGRDINY